MIVFRPPVTISNASRQTSMTLTVIRFSEMVRGVDALS